ncbi:MAG TPA: phage tail sheath subtilisin-like domain-containing protein [Pyrinomonadaceae bacterium]|jgi:hypothetical protein
MMSFTIPGVHLRETEVAQPGLLRMSVTGFVGQAERGPLNYPQQINSWGQYRDIFGDFVGYAYLPYCVFGFFLNGGERCYVVRVSHETARPSASFILSGISTSVSAPVAAGASKAPVASAKHLRVGMQVLIDDGFNRARVRVKSIASAQDAFDFETVETDSGGNPVPFPAINPDASVSEVIVEVTAMNAGRWGNELYLAAEETSTRDLILTELKEDLLPGQSVATFKSVAGLLGADLVGAARADRVTLQDERNPVQEELTIDSIDYAARKVTFKSPVTSPAGFRARSGVIGKGFKLTFQSRRRNVLVREEVFDNLSMNPAHERYFVKVINGEPESLDYAQRMRQGNSILARVQDLCVLLNGECPRPAGAESQQFSGGDDDPSKITAQHLTGYTSGAYFRPVPPGADAATVKKIKEQYFGLAAFELVPEIGLITIPDLHVPDFYAGITPTQIPKEGIIFAKAQASVRNFDNLKQGQREMLRHCEVMTDRFALFDSPRGAETGKGSNKIEDWAGLFQLTQGSKNCALYYPWVREKASDFEQRNLFVPPSGHVAGIYARTESERGVGHAPANELLHGVVEFEFCLSDTEQSVLNPRGVNCLRSFPGRGQRVWGARTLSLDPIWRYVNVRRLALAIIKQILLNLQWTVFEPNDVRLWNRIVATLNLFMNGLFQSNVLAGAKPEQAFFVKCDEETNPPESIERGQVITLIGFAPARPAEFVLVTIKRTAESVSVKEASTA